MTVRTRLLLIPALAALSAPPGAAQDTIRPAAPPPGARAPVLGASTVNSVKVENGVRTPTSTTMMSITEGMDGGQAVYRVSSYHTAAGRRDPTTTSIIVRKSDLALLRHRVQAAGDSAVVSWSNGRLTGWVALPGEPVRLLDLDAPRPVYPVDGPAPWFVPTLPLREGYRAVVPRFSMWEGKEVYQEIQVVGSEPVGRGGGAVDCWKVDTGPFAIPGYRAFLWVDKRSGAVLQSALLGPAGGAEYWGVAE